MFIHEHARNQNPHAWYWKSWKTKTRCKPQNFLTFSLHKLIGLRLAFRLPWLSSHLLSVRRDNENGDSETGSNGTTFVWCKPKIDISRFLQKNDEKVIILFSCVCRHSPDIQPNNWQLCKYFLELLVLNFVKLSSGSLVILFRYNIYTQFVFYFFHENQTGFLLHKNIAKI